MTKTEEHKHYWLGENLQHHESEATIIKMSYPRCFIRFNMSDAYYSDIDEFYFDIAEVQWFDGDTPTEREQTRIMVEAWNFIAIEERLLENAMAEIDEFEFE